MTEKELKLLNLATGLRLELIQYGTIDWFRYFEEIKKLD